MKHLIIFIATFLIRLLLTRFCIAYTSLDFSLIFIDEGDRSLFIGTWVMFWFVWWLIWVLFYNDMKEYNLFT